MWFFVCFCVMYVCCMFHIILCICVLTCRLVRLYVSIDIQEATLPLLLYGASSISLPATWHCLPIGTAKHYGACAISIGTHWPGHECRDIAYDNDQICGPAVALLQILTPSLHRHVETLWSPWPLHRLLSYSFGMKRVTKAWDSPTTIYIHVCIHIHVYK